MLFHWLIYVKSEAAANRVMKSFSNYLEKKLKLEVNVYTAMHT